MKFALTLTRYISKQFLISFIIVVSVFSILSMLLDAVELLRKASSRQIPFFIMLDMVILKLPMILQVIMPFITLVASVLAYTTLARRSELVVIRSSGVSVWEFLFPAAITAFAIGVVIIVILNPISAIMINKYEHLYAKYFENKENLLDISDTGLWFKQEYKILPEQKDEKNNDQNVMIIHAREVSGSNEILLKGVEILSFNNNDDFLFRIDAEKGSLIDKMLTLSNVTVTSKENVITNVNNFSLATNIKQRDIQKSFTEPEAISFFELPNFIKKLEDSGFSAIAHILQFHKTLSSPFFYAAMVLIGAIFSLKAPRQGIIGYSITLSIIFGFIIYFLSNLVTSIGLSGAMPIMVAAWMPVIITLLIGVGLLLHYEDG